MKPNSKYLLKSLLYLIVITLFVGCNISSNKKQPIVQTSVEKDSIPQKLSVKSMQEDLVILWSAIKEMHPGYGYYTPADSLQIAFDQTYSSVSKPLYEDEFIAQLYPWICKLRCGHTQIKHSEEYKQPAGLFNTHLPFEVLVNNHHRVLVTTRQTEALHTGDEIISINDVAVAGIIKHGFDLYSTDGYNETFKELFLSEYDGFDDACNKYYRWPGPYKLQIRTTQGELKTLTVNAAATGFTPPTTKTIDNYANWTTAKNTGNLTLRFLNNSSTALFETKPFSYDDPAIYKEVFKQINEKKIKNLVLDMRHNTGGDIRVAIQLLSYLADSSFSIIKDVKSRLPDPVLNHSEKYFDSTRTNGFIQGFKIDGKEGLWYHVISKPAMGAIYGPLPLTKEHHFTGNLYVLIDGATFSSGALFTAALKSQRKNAKFIGRETAGAEEGCNGMTVQELTLPNTKVRIDFPWMRVESVARNPIRGRGIMPDYEVDYSPEDVISKRDRDLEKVLDLIK
jgi:C-terminal processing protease CtpA/Prc